MPTPDTTSLPADVRPTAVWATTLLHAVARDEIAGRRAPRLTESRLDTWRRFRGRLDSTDFVALLFEDAAVIHRVPFDADVIGGDFRLDQLPPSFVDGWLAALPSTPLQGASADYILEQAKALALPTRMARSELHVVKSHQKVLELPGTGGQLAHHLVSSQRDLTLHENFVVACGSWQELTLAGIVGLDLGAPHSDYVVKTHVEDLRNSLNALRQRTFDFVIGLHPDKGGLLRVEDQLAIWFPGATVLLV